MTELVEREGVLVLVAKDGSTRVVTNYVSSIVALVKTGEVLEGVLVEHAPKETTEDMKQYNNTFTS